jgi:hypothetical protein
MIDNQQEPTFEFQDWFDGGDIFYRSKDKQRFQLALNAMIDDDLGLAVIGTNETVLDHYCRMLVARLRDVNMFQVEVFLPTNTDSLLKRFNEMLATMTMEQARQPADPASPVKLLVVNDAKSVNEEQWALLVRLLSDFPGVNVRLVLFLDKTGWPNYEKPLTLFGRKLYRWVVDTPTLDEASQLMKAAVEHGFERETETLLMHTGLGAAIRGGYAEEDPDEFMPPLPDTDESDYLGEDFSEANPFPLQPVEFLDDDIAAEEDDYDQPRKGLGKNWSLILAFLLSLGITWVLVSQLDSDEGGIAAPGPVSNPGDITQSAVKQPESLVSQNPEPQKSLLQKESQADQAAALVEALRQEQQQAQTVAPQPVLEQTVPAAPVVKPRALSAQQRAIATVQKARDTDFFVQHIVLSDKPQADLYKQRYSGLGSAIVVPIKTSTSVAYAVISGPFASRERAEKFAKGSGRPADYWIRGASQLGVALDSN